MTKVWDCYRAQTLAASSQQVRRLREWVGQTLDMPEKARDKTFDFCRKAGQYKRS